MSPCRSPGGAVSGSESKAVLRWSCSPLNTAWTYESVVRFVIDMSRTASRKLRSHSLTRAIAAQSLALSSNSRSSLCLGLATNSSIASLKSYARPSIDMSKEWQKDKASTYVESDALMTTLSSHPVSASTPVFETWDEEHRLHHPMLLQPVREIS